MPRNCFGEEELDLSTRGHRKPRRMAVGAKQFRSEI